MDSFTQGRDRLLQWLRSQLIGPASEEEELSGSPLNRYPTGILFPIVRSGEGFGLDTTDEEDTLDPLGNEGPVHAKATLQPYRYTASSSVGFSFFVRGDVIQIRVRCSAARYVQTTHRYKRVPLVVESLAPFYNGLAGKDPSVHQERVSVLEHRAGLDVLWRPYATGWMVTVSLFNQQELNAQGSPKEYPRDRVEKSLFEVVLRCSVEIGEIGAYPHVDKRLLDDEEQALELQYKGRKIYAVGHGAAVDWMLDGKTVTELRSNFLPSVEVPQVTAEVVGRVDPVLHLAYLATETQTVRVCEALHGFVQGYANWIETQRAQTNILDADEHTTAERMVARMVTTLQRMYRGVACIAQSPRVAESFRIANRAMLDQMCQVDRMRGHPRSVSEYRWRPFQLAFLLTVMESVLQEDHDFRDVIDLIWFPTGGGKTEAYLGLIAFLIVWRRFTYGASGGGTTVLMRYTLRLLTAQQYLRATRIICALELIRRQTPLLNTGEPITIGMWVGAATSPNRYTEALKMVQRASAGQSTVLHHLVLHACPWCDKPFRAPENYIATPEAFYFRCTNDACDFGRVGGGILPCNVVDEALYREPPTLLVATIDKMARLSWEERAHAFFGTKGNRPPELVIQDELHLIAGALGSVAGLYEAALDTVLHMRGVRPKYIASTATIRMAQDQVKRLYGRALAVFPPPGLSCDDSYFACTIPTTERPGRMYVGYLAQMLDRKHCMAPLVAALLAAPEILFYEQQQRDELLEAWWTQVIYNNSLKDVGSSHNAFHLGVRDALLQLSEEYKRHGRTLSRTFPRIAQLTSISSVEENAKTFSRLEKIRGDVDCLDAVLATNMISVGLDITRLALMIINGQPLTSAEYIQASSRVGRGEVPGLVFANFYRDQARSLSHYENFRPYHDAFYRFVEPTSVTPYTYQARTRALHAALVIAIRHAGPSLLCNTQAGQFDPASAYVQQVVRVLKKRCLAADPDRAHETHAHLDRLVEQWRTETIYCTEHKRQLNYESHDNNADRLLYNHDDPIKGLWLTLQSMRTVENTAFLELSE